MENGYIKISKEDYDALFISNEYYNTLMYGGMLIEKNVFNNEGGFYENITYMAKGNEAFNNLIEQKEAELEQKEAELKKRGFEIIGLEKQLIKSKEKEKKCILF